MARRRRITLTKKWEDYVNKHVDKKFLICGLGPSFDTINLEDYKDYIKIGVNDIESKFKPDYLVIVDRINTFKGKRRDTIINTTCNTIFVNNDQFSRELGNFNHQALVSINLININKDEGLFTNKIHFSNNSTFIACDIARLMGAKEISMIGVDFTDNKSLDNPKQIQRINADFNKLQKAFLTKGVKLYNLSKNSKLNLQTKYDD